jgi:hypothetical protein
LEEKPVLVVAGGRGAVEGRQASCTLSLASLAHL